MPPHHRQESFFYAFRHHLAQRHFQQWEDAAAQKGRAKAAGPGSNTASAATGSA